MEASSSLELSHFGLVVGGNDEVRAAVATALSEIGFAVVESADEAHALEIAAARRPDLCVIDVERGAPLGLSFCETLRAATGQLDLPIVALVGQDDAESIADVFDAGVTDLVSKPLQHPVLSYRIRHVLRSEALMDELRRSEETLENAQRIARLGTWEWDLTTGTVLWSDEARRLIGFPDGAVNAQFHDFLVCVHKEDATRVAQTLEATLRGEASFDLDHRIVRPADGAVRFLHSQAEVARDADGQPVAMSGTVQDISERKKAERQIRFLAFFDSLTGLPNRLQFTEQLKKALALARRNRRLAAVMFMDLDNFKRINDTAGHSAGDSLLRLVAERLKDAIRVSDMLSRDEDVPSGTVARLGGDEFIVLVPDLVRAEDTAKVAGRILESFHNAFLIEGNEVFVSTSIGISIFPQDGADAEELLKNADAALYHAKDTGRNNFQFYSPALNDSAFRRLSLESSLRKAIERNEFIVHYQPQVLARDGRLVGVEALIRWNHPDLGLVYPGQFIPLAEETGLIQSIDEWVLREACSQNGAWQRAGLPKIHVAVNLSGHQFRRRDLIERVVAATTAANIEPRFVELEITESVLMQHAADTLEILNELKQRGFRIAVDDFGTGYSSLAYLKRFRADVLKIDRSFVRDIATSSDDAAIVAAIVTLAENLKMIAIAEGVESTLQRSFLHEQGCDLMQGYLFGRPAPPDVTESLLRLQAGRAEQAEALAAAPELAAAGRDDGPL